MMYQSIKTLSSQAAQYIGKPVEIRGWVRTRRDSKAGFSFLVVHDGSCFDAIQVVVPQDCAHYQDKILRLTAGCSVIVKGTLMASQGKEQGVEIQASAVDVLGFVEDPDHYPISPKPHTLEYLRDVLHLRVRTNTHGAVSRIRHGLMQAIHRFFNDAGFFWVNTPIITASDCEGAGELFRVSTLDLMHLSKTSDGKINFAEDFFGKEAFLTVSGQLNVEAYCLALSKVYTFGPTFRAENSNTSRHLAEFWMVEPEIAFADLQDDIALAQDLLKFVFKTILENYADDMAFFEKRIDPTCITRLQSIIDTPFTVMTYDEAINILQTSGQTFAFPVAWGLDLQSEHERYLTEVVIKGPVVVTHYPKTIKSFYMRLNDDDKTVSAMDVLVPGIGEIIGGSQREERLSVLDARLQECHLDPAQYDWYRDLRRYGTVPHAGFGLGFERLVSYVTGLNNVRDVIPFPRTPKHAAF